MGMGLQPLLAFLVLAEGCSRALCLVLPLNGDWRVYNRNKSYQFSGSVPGNVHTDLMRAKLIGDAYFRNNDEKQAWVAREDWTYSRDFQLSEEVLSHRRILLVAHGIDTIANVYVNDILLGSTENMFVRYRFDIKPHVKPGYNNVTVELSSPVLYAVDRARASARVHAIPPECPPLRQRSVCSANQIRKTQTSFGWELAPAFPTMGIWKDIGIEIYNVLIIRDMVVRTRCQRTTRPNRWVLDVRLFLELGFSGKKILQLNLEFDKRLTVHKNISISAKNDLTSLYRFRLRIPQSLQIETWWPHGYGKAKLYPLFISLSRGSETATLERSIGFRTIDLVQEPLVNGTGATFFLRVNGVPLFAKGSNWVPPDAFQDRVTPERLAQLLDGVVSARMNMLRVWGGGVYESDLFYSMADHRGILVWQDFMFANALYPATPAFLDSVADEARQQIRRLGHHPSLVLWCGNSENELGMAYNWWKPLTQEHRVDYVKLYVETLQKTMYDEDMSRQFLGSSPSNGILSELNEGVNDNPNDVLYGDVHYYDYYSPPWSLGSVPTPRFCSGFGLVSFPSFETLSTAFAPEDLVFPFSQLIENRLHLANSRLEIYISSVLNLPRKDGSEQSFKVFIILSQVYQAMGVKTQAEHFRRHRLTLRRSRGLTMGALYWHLNDVWQAPSWSSIDYLGNWKMLHYFAVRFFAPQLVSAYVDGDRLLVYAIDDLYAGEPYDLRLDVRLYHYGSFVPRLSLTHVFPMSSLVQVVSAKNLSELLSSASCSRNNSFLTFRLSNDSDGETLSNNFLLLQVPRLATEIPSAALKISNVSALRSEDENLRGSNVHEIQLKTDAVALFVWLSAGRVRGRFSDNGFIMVDKTTSLTFTSDLPLDVAQLLLNISVTCLNCLRHAGYSPMADIKTQ